MTINREDFRAPHGLGEIDMDTLSPEAHVIIHRRHKDDQYGMLRIKGTNNCYLVIDTQGYDYAKYAIILIHLA